MTYEAGPWIWIRICNYFLYGFRKRLFGPLFSVATFASNVRVAVSASSLCYHGNDFCMLISSLEAVGIVVCDWIRKLIFVAMKTDIKLDNI